MEGGRRRNPVVRATGFRVRQPSSGRPNRAGSNLSRSHCRCLAPPAKAHGGGSRRSGSPATSLLGPRVSRGVSSSARTAIADIAIAASSAASKPAFNSGDGQRAGTSRARKAGSIIATGSESTGAAGGLDSRDGSGFPFDHFPGIIRMWTGGCRPPVRSSGSRAAAIYSLAGRKLSRAFGCAAGSAAARAFHRSVSTHSTTKVSPIS